MADGHLNKCKECNKIDVKLNRRKNSEYYSNFDKNRNSSEQRKQQRKKNLIRERELFPEKSRARDKVARAIKSGKIKRPPKCERCGKLDQGEKVSDLHAHHFDYSNPLDVIFLCAKCHGQERHKIKIPDFYPID